MGENPLFLQDFPLATWVIYPNSKLGITLVEEK